MRVIAVIPALNEEKTLAQILIETEKHVDKIIVCDDGSTNHTSLIAERFSTTVIKHKINLGYGQSLQDLFNLALSIGATIIVTLDADGQHNPQDIPSLVEPIKLGKADIVVGSRFLAGSTIPRLRRLGIALIGKATRKASGLNLSDVQCGFRAYSEHAIRTLNLLDEGMGLSVEMIMKANDLHLRIVEVPVNVRYEGLDTSQHNPLVHGIKVMETIVQHVIERKPLIYFGVPAILFFGVGTFFLAWATQLYLERGVLVTNITLIGLFSLLACLFFTFTAITLYVLSRIRKMINGRMKS